jgi:hypothetical protein
MRRFNVTTGRFPGVDVDDSWRGLAAFENAGDQHRLPRDLGASQISYIALLALNTPLTPS